MHTYDGALLVVALIAGVWWLLGSDKPKPEQKGKGKSKVAMVFWGLIAAWAIKNRHRFPLRWQVAGGLALAAALAFVFDVPEIAWPVLAATLALATVNVVRPPSSPRDSPDQLARDWPAMIEASPALAPVLKGSTVTKVERDQLGRTVHVTLAGARTASELHRLTPHLDALFEARVGAVRVQADPGAAHRAVLRVLPKDSLEATIPWPGPRAQHIEEPVPLGVDESGRVIAVRLLGGHILIAGISGAGKSTVLEVLVRSLMAMDDVAIWGIDRKQGMELGPWRKRMARFDVEDGETVQLLTDARAEIDARGKEMAADELRQWPVSPERKAVVLLIDELARVSAEGKQVLADIVAQGRASAVIAVMATQYPSTDTFGPLGGTVRSQLGCTIGLKVRTAADDRVVFGEQATAEGWAPHRLSGKGGFLIRDDDHPEPIPARAFWPGS